MHLGKSVFEWTQGMASDWSESTRYFRGDIVEPTTATGYVYRADVIAPNSSGGG